MKKLLLILLCLPFIVFGQDLDFTSEASVREYLDKTDLEEIEGIYQFNISGSSGAYKIALIKDGFQFKGVTIDTDKSSRIGKTKMILEESAAPGVYSMKYFMNNGSKKSTTAFYKPGLIEFTYWGNDKEI